MLAVGPGLDWWEGAGVRMPVKPGDHVVFPASAGAWVEVDEEKLLVCRVGELLGVLEEADEPASAPARVRRGGGVEPAIGLEPMTPSLRVKCSTN